MIKLLDFVCKSCSTKFEELIKDETKVKCPKCGSFDVEKVISGFATLGSNRTESSSSCSTSKGFS